MKMKEIDYNLFTTEQLDRLSAAACTITSILATLTDGTMDGKVALYTESDTYRHIVNLNCTAFNHFKLRNRQAIEAQWRAEGYTPPED